jgi:sarcosine oxidase
VNYDIAVVGLGGMGSSIVAHCAERGASVIGLEQFQRLHDLGSSHGKTRMIRKAYFEDPAYVPLLHRTYELWGQLERVSGQKILHITGLLSVGEETSEIIQGTRRAAAEHDLPVDTLSQREIQSRYPTLRLEKDELGLFEKDGGVLDPELAIDVYLRLAQSNGATMRFGVTMQEWHPTGTGFDLSLTDGTRISANKLILALGAWVQPLLESLGVSVRVQRNVQAWFLPATHVYDVPNFPGFLLNRRGLPAPLYGFPDFGDGIKAAFHGLGDLTTATQIDREIDEPTDVIPIARALEKWMPGAADSFREAKACMYTLTPDQHFVIDHHPSHKNLILCGGFSGHGFKFAPVVGEIAADLALAGGCRHQIEFLSVRRFDPV